MIFLKFELKAIVSNLQIEWNNHVTLEEHITYEISELTTILSKVKPFSKTELDYSRELLVSISQIRMYMIAVW